jgi:glycosyltransferase involved in cell wall biosynthesis
MRYLFFILPGDNEDSPIKGAVPLANSIYTNVNNMIVKIVYLKKYNMHASLGFNKNIKVLYLSNNSSISFIKIFKFIFMYRNINNIFISCCLSADLLNFINFKSSIKLSSIRGNLNQNYFYQYGYFGYLLAFFHYKILQSMTCVLVLTDQMKRYIEMNYKIKNVMFLGNCINESLLNKYKKNNNKDNNVIFLGSITKRKNPFELISLCKYLISRNVTFKIHVVGTGPLENLLKQKLIKLNLINFFIFHGYVKTPYNLLNKSKVLFNPSFSEGMSRSVMEALYLNVPCVIRNVDGADEIISQKNGYLFTNDNYKYQIYEILMNIKTFKGILLPEKFRMQSVTDNFKKIINNYD